MKVAVVVVAAALFGCGPPPPPPRAQVDESCDGVRCEDGLACVDLGDGESPLCAQPDASCDPADLCACDVLDELCPAENIGSACISSGARVTLECALPAGGEGEGEGE